MDRTQLKDYQRQVEKYLESRKVYELFEELLKQVSVAKPVDPLDYLIERLSNPEHRMLFIVGPPGSNVRELALQLSDHFRYTCLSVGDLLRKEVGKKTEQGVAIEQAIKSGRYVNDSIVIDLVQKQIQTMQKEKKNCIIEGFPKTVVQGLAMQKAGIIPTSFLIMSATDQKIEETVGKKFNLTDSYWSTLPDKIRERMAANYALEYKLNLNAIQRIYEHQYFQVDTALGKEELLEEMARYTRFRLKSRAPRRSPKILIVGAPGAGKTTLGRNLARRYGFTLASLGELMNDQIAKKTEIGRLSLQATQSGDVLPDEVLGGLISVRMGQSDVAIHGAVLDGFPEESTQLKLLEELDLHPTVIVVVDLELPDATKRVGGRGIDILKKQHARWKELLKAIEQQYSTLIFKVSGSKAEKNVFEEVSYALENNFS